MRSPIVAAVAVGVIRWRVLGCFIMSTLADFSIYHWSAGIATQAAGSPIIPRATPATTGHWGQSNKWLVKSAISKNLIGQRVGEYKLEIDERKMGSG